MSADVAQIRRHGDGRRLATLLATVRRLEAKSIDEVARAGPDLAVPRRGDFCTRPPYQPDDDASGDRR